MIRRARSDDNEQWAPVSDLMAALMLIFMFITIVFISEVVEAKEAKSINSQKCAVVYQDIETKFESDFEDWDAELLDDLTIRFRKPKVLFPSGEDNLPPEFERILRNFFPRYMEVIRSPEHRDDIREVRIEGHTSSEWSDAQSELDAYFRNMELSQRRTRAILRFVLNLPEADDYAAWARSRITANGLSSSRPILTGTDEEDRTRSRRVEFRLLATSCQKAGRYDEINEGASNAD